MNTVKMKTQQSQLSDWSMAEPTSSDRRYFSTVKSQNKNNLTNNTQDYNINQDQPNNQQEKRWTLSSSLVEYLSSSAPFLYGLLLGVLSNGLGLGIIIALWLTSGNKKTSTTAPIQLRWNSTGITILGIVGMPGSAPNQTSHPYGMAFDSLGALYLADCNNNRVQKTTISTFTAVTVAGNANGTAGAGPYYLSQPVDMAFDGNNNMYLSERGNERVQFFTRGNLSGTIVAGVTGLAGNASGQLNFPAGIVYDSNTGNLYIADTYNQRVMQYQSGASFGTVVAGGNGNGLSTSQLSQPFGLYLNTFSNSFFIPNYGTQNVVQWKIVDSNWTLVAGSLTGTVGNNATSFNQPIGITFDLMGNMYVADSGHHRIQFFLSGQSTGTTIAGITGVNGTNATLLNRPYWVTLDNQLNLYVSDTYNQRVQMFERY